MGATGGTVRVLWGSTDTASVTITGRNGQKASFTVNGTAVTFPVTLTGSTSFDTTFDGDYLLSVKHKGVEIADTPDGGKNFTLHAGQQLIVSPSVDLSSVTGDQAVATLSNTFARLAPMGAYLPTAWDAQWQAAKTNAANGTGTAKIAFIGDSVTAGQSGGTVTDALTYGFVGRLDTMLSGTLGGYAEGYTIAGLQTGTGTLNAPSSPYSNIGTNQQYDGGVGALFIASVTGTNWLTISVPAHPVTGAMPTAVDLITVDYNTNQWSYKLDGGSAVTITCAGPGTPGNGIMRRTSISLPGSTTHSIVLSEISPNGLLFVGHVAYYGTSGVGIMRNGIPGYKAVDFSTGGGATASSTGNVSATPDHIKPWSGVNDSFNNSGSTFPWAPDLAVIMLGGNDITFGSTTAGFERAITRFIHAFRRGVPASSTSPGCSILFLDQDYPSAYNDNTGAVGIETYESQRITRVLQSLAATYNCGYMSLSAILGETPLANGLVASGNIHPTQNGLGAGGGDGHLAIANAINSVL